MPNLFDWWIADYIATTRQAVTEIPLLRQKVDEQASRIAFDWWRWTAYLALAVFADMSARQAVGRFK